MLARAIQPTPLPRSGLLKAKYVPRTAKATPS
jgi:hypothetical protein